MIELAKIDAEVEVTTLKPELSDLRIDEEKIGKPTGIVIKEQKMSLPLIYALNHSDKKEKAWVINSVKNHNKDKKRVNEVIAYVKESGGLDYAVAKMKALQQEALKILDKYPESKYKEALMLMVNYVIERKK